MFIGAGTVANVATVLIGGGAGVMIGHLLKEHTRRIITDALGLVTVVIAAQAAVAVFDTSLEQQVGTSAPMLVMLGALVGGGIIGSWLRIEYRLEALGGWMQVRLGTPAQSVYTTENDGAESGYAGNTKARFIEGFVTASLVFCVGPLTILGALQDGLGHGADQLFLKSSLDGFAALAFAASFGVGVMASALSVAAIQGALTLAGVALGSFLPEAYLSSISAAGGLILFAVALRLMNIAKIAVGDLLPALVIAPVLVGAITVGMQTL